MRFNFISANIFLMFKSIPPYLFLLFYMFTLVKMLFKNLFFAFFCMNKIEK